MRPNRSLALRKQYAASSSREQRALDAAETILEASGLRYQSGQIAGLALLLVMFAEHEIRLAERARDQSPAVDAVREDPQ